MTAFCFIDKVAEVKKRESLTALYTLKGAEEFLQDHFEGFPVMPGVLLLESLKQAASRLMGLSGESKPPFFRLARAEEVKFGQFVRPGNLLKIFVRQLKEEGCFVFFEGRIDQENGRKVLTAKLVLEPVGN